MNGQTPACDITDVNGNFRFTILLTDLQGGSSTPDVIIKVFFENDDFKIIRQDYNFATKSVNQNNPATVHYVLDMADPRFNITGPIFNYGTFELPTTEHSSRSSYILNSLQPVHDWYDETVNYNPDKSTILWTPEVCASVGVFPSSNVLEVGEDFNVIRSDIRCPDSVYSALENPHTLRHEYAHQVQNQIYLDIDTTIDNSDCNNPHSPVHNSGVKCAWTEGWAFFMATIYDENPVYQPYYMLGQWNFETRDNTELIDSRFAGKSFVSGNQEGNVAAALYDIVDSTNEAGDDLQNGLGEIWNTFQQRPVKTISAFEQNWNDDGLFSLDQIFNLNTIRVDPTLTITPLITVIVVYQDKFVI